MARAGPGRQNFRISRWSFPFYAITDCTQFNTTPTIKHRKPYLALYRTYLFSTNRHISSSLILNVPNIFTMELVYGLIQQRNDFETLPFLEVHNSNANLTSLVRKLRGKCQALETECHHQQEDLTKVCWQCWFDLHVRVFIQCLIYVFKVLSWSSFRAHS